jgi:hypothetical protein
MGYDDKTLARFWSKVNKTDGCWLWTAGKDGWGYGCFHPTSHEMKKAHRVAFFLANGHWPILLQHTCDQPLCVYPGHLVEGTQKTNVADKVAKGRQAKGVDNGRSKLSEEDVRTIRFIAGAQTKTNLAKSFSVDRRTILDILQRRTWRHIK